METTEPAKYADLLCLVCGKESGLFFKRMDKTEGCFCRGCAPCGSEQNIWKWYTPKDIARIRESEGANRRPASSHAPVEGEAFEIAGWQGICLESEPDDDRLPEWRTLDRGEVEAWKREAKIDPTRFEVRPLWIRHGLSSPLPARPEGEGLPSFYPPWEKMDVMIGGFSPLTFQHEPDYNDAPHRETKECAAAGCVPVKIIPRAASLHSPAAGSRDRLRELKGALTPNTETKAAYMGEFKFPVQIGQHRVGVTVPWTTIKKIMAAISARALSKEKQP